MLECGSDYRASNTRKVAMGGCSLSLRYAELLEKLPKCQLTSRRRDVNVNSGTSYNS